MSSTPIFLFDVMDTLVSEPFFTSMPAFFDMPVDQLRREMHPTSWIEFEEGRITESEYYTRFFLDGRPVDAKALRACVKGAFHWLDGIESLLAELKSAGYPMHAMSNYSVWYLMIEEKLCLSRYLAWSFVSCVTGVRKPAPEAYLNAARSLDVPPGQCVFVDDRPVNVEAAKALGMDGILKTDAGELRAEFVRRGLL